MNAMTRVARTCSIEGCDRSHNALGFCGMHYQRFRRHGDPSVNLRMQRKGCDVEGCPNPHYGLGYCRIHWWRFKRHGDPLVLKQRAHVTQHGTRNEYGNYGCRCAECRAAAAEYQKQRNRTFCTGCGAKIWKRGNKPVTGLCTRCVGLSRRIDEHGTDGMYRRGCRCDLCRRHQAEMRAANRRANRERERAYNRQYKARVRAAARMAA